MSERIDPTPLILIVEDDESSASLLESILTREGFRTTLAASGVTGRARAIELNPDLILMDIQMPEEDGLTACQKLKAHPATTAIPIIFLTAIYETSAKLRGFSLGAVDYITKPYETAEVLARVRLHLKLHHAYRDLVEAHIYKLQQLTEAQQSILPHPEDFPEANFFAFYQPLEEAGGDFFDVLPVGTDIFDYVVADVCGHDLGSSLATASLKALLHHNPRTLYSLPESLGIINEVMCGVLSKGKYLTLSMARLNRMKRKLTLVSAGHPPPIYVRKDRYAAPVESQGDIIGILPTITLETREINISPGDRFYLYTDGLIEIQHNGSRISRQGGIIELTEICAHFHELPLHQAVPGIVGHIFPKEIPPADDILLLGVEI